MIQSVCFIFVMLNRHVTVNSRAAKLYLKIIPVSVAMFLSPWKLHCQLTAEGRRQGKRLPFISALAELLIAAASTLAHIQLGLMFAAHVFGFSTPWH